MYTENKEDTIRRRMIELLEQKPATALEISRAIHISEKDVYEHLSHVGKSVVAKGGTLRIHPAECQRCGFVFTERKRFRPPGKCPKCKSTHLSKPTYEIVSD